MERDGTNKSLWQVIESYTPVNNVGGNRLYDVIVIGGGITGLTTALLLQTADKKFP